MSVTVTVAAPASNAAVHTTEPRHDPGTSFDCAACRETCVFDGDVHCAVNVHTYGGSR